MVPLRKQPSLRSLVSAIGFIAALLFGLLVPLSYGIFEYHELGEDLSFKARLNAGRVSKYVYAHPDFWQYHGVRLAELIELPQAAGAPIWQRVIDSANNVVAQAGPALSDPLLKRSAPIIVNGVTVGRIEAEADLSSFLTVVFVMMLAGFVLSSLGYLAFRVLPLRILDRTIGELTTQNARFDAALSNMTQGLCMFDPEHRIVVANARYAAMYNLSPDQVVPGTTFLEVLRYRLARGTYPLGPGPEDYAASTVDSLHSKVVGSKVTELADGRFIAVVSRLMQGGGWVATHEDVTEQRRAEARIAHMAHHDALTDLPNRLLMRERLEGALATPSKHRALAVLCLDLDRFKEVNDTLGHSVGDALLKQVAQRLKACLKEGDTVARLSGDEFAIIQTSAVQPTGATALAAHVIDAIGVPFLVNDHQIVIGTSVGISVSPSDTSDPGQLLKNADLALYRAKSEGRQTYCFFEPGMDARMHARRRLEMDLRQALADGAFELHYQPIVDLDSNRIVSLEALLRWNHPEHGKVSPADFIPLAEETGLIVAIGEWALRAACVQAAQWPAHLKVAVNLSPAQLNQNPLVEVVASALAVSGLAASRLELEITETALLENTQRTLATLHQLQHLGVRISMDDFGTGYSSLSNLRSFPFDKIKIDQSFIRGLGNDAQSSAIVQAVVGLGANLGIATTAEGVETRDQLDWLRMLGVTEVQGFYISAPKPSAAILNELSQIPACMRAAA